MTTADALFSTGEAVVNQPGDDIADGPTSPWPTVGVVVPTRDRPELLRRALAAIWDQDYPGRIDVIVVYDGEESDNSVCREAPGRRIRVTTNRRSPGLAGARNTGINKLSTELVAFCDDDDLWNFGKLTTQARRLQAEPTTEMLTCGIVVSFAGHQSPRLAGRELIEYPDLLSSRLAMLHSSTFVLRRTALLDGIGLLDETIPGSQNEDWDLLLRSARRQPIRHVDEPLVRVLWGQSSYFSRQWQTRVSSLHWMLRHHPDIAADRTGAARVYGQLAFGYAALGKRRTSFYWVGRSLRRRWREPRWVLALAVAVRLLPADVIVAALHRRGHGI